MNIGIGADLGGLKSGLKSAQKQITSFSEGVESRLNSISTSRLQKGISNIGTSAVPTASKLQSSLGKVQKSTRSSTAAVVNFNRVIQDAPFGIMGVANNLEPMITEFQKLGGASATTTDKLKELLTSAFTGPGALITTVSIASTLMIAFGDNLFGAGKKANEASDRIKGLASAAEELNSVLQQDTGLADQIQREIDRNKEAISLAERRGEIEIKLGKLAQQGASERITELQNERDAIDNLIASLGFEQTALSSLEKNLTTLQFKQKLYNEEIGNAEQRTAAFVDAIQGDAQRAIQNYEAGITSSTEQIEKQRSEVLRLLGDYRQLARDGNETARRAAVALSKTLNNLNSKLEDGEAKTVSYSTSVDDVAVSFEQAEDKIIGFGNAFENINKILGSDLEDDKLDLSKKLFPPGSIGALESKISGFKQQLQFATEPQRIQLLQSKIQGLESRLKSLRGEGKKSMSVLAGFTNLVGNALTRAVVQGNNLGNILSSIARQLASQAIITGLKLLTGVASGGFFSTLFGGFFANGGNLPMGQWGIVGEEGPEVVMPTSSGAKIEPIGTGNRSMAGMGRQQRGRQKIEVFGKIQGEDIFLSSERGGNTYNR